MIGCCGCCVILDRDMSVKPVKWCQMCQAWLCDGCRGNWWRRAQAFGRQAVGA